MPRAARSFADDLRVRSDEDLAALFVARPDLARPTPADITSLAARAGTRASVQRALEHLNAHSLRLVEALLVVGDAGAARALGTTKKAVDAELRVLWRLALVWRASDGWRPVRAVGDVLGRPAALGPSAQDLGIRQAELGLTADSSPEQRQAVENGLSEQARAVLDQLRWSSPRASFTSPTLRSVRAELIRAGLMAPLEGDEAMIPREVGLALRDGRLYQDEWSAPTPQVPMQDPARVDEAAAAAVLDLLWRFDDIAAVWDEAPPRVLRSGGLSVRDHRALAVAIDSSTDLVSFLLEIGFAAGLFAPDAEIDSSWRPTDLYDEWSAWPPARRWERLALAWRDMTRAPSLGGQTVDGSLINVLGRDANWPLLRRRRADVLHVLASLPTGAAPSLEAVEELLRWRRPLHLPAGAPTRVEVVLREAEWLGVTGLGALSDAGRALLESPAPGGAPSGQSAATETEAARIMNAALPEPISQIMVQGDLTAVAPGPLTEEVAAFMRRGAVVESRGGATVFRFTEEGLRNLLDGGLTAAEVLERLARYSMTPVPQALEYLVHDVARRHGHLRVGSVGSYVRGDDDHALDALMADASLTSLQLRRIAPTVAVSPVPAATLLDKLREARHAPVAETSDGGVVVRGQHSRRSPTPRHSSSPVRVTSIDEERAAELAREVRAGEAHAVRPSAHDAQERIPSTDPTVTLTMLDEAAAEHLPVWIGFVDSAGDIKRSLFHPDRVDGGRVTGRMGSATHSSTLSIHRITGVAQA